MTLPPLKPVRVDELERRGLRGSTVTGVELFGICAGVGGASFFAANPTHGVSMMIGVLLAPAVVISLARRRAASTIGVVGSGAAAVFATVAAWVLCIVVLLIVGLLTGATSPV